MNLITWKSKPDNLPKYGGNNDQTVMQSELIFDRFVLEVSKFLYKNMLVDRDKGQTIHTCSVWMYDEEDGLRRYFLQYSEPVPELSAEPITQLAERVFLNYLRHEIDGARLDILALQHKSSVYQDWLGRLDVTA